MTPKVIDTLHDGDFDEALSRLKEVEEHMPFNTPLSDAFLDPNWFLSLYLGHSSELELMARDVSPSGAGWCHASLWLYREHRFANPSVLVYIYHDDTGRSGAAVIPHYRDDSDRRRAIAQMYEHLGSHARVMIALQTARDELNGTFERERREMTA